MAIPLIRHIFRILYVTSQKGIKENEKITLQF